MDIKFLGNAGLPAASSSPSFDPTALSGYDATKKQELVNDEGTLKWKNDDSLYITEHTVVEGENQNNILAPDVDDIFDAGVYKGILVAQIGFSDHIIPFELYVRVTEDSSGFATSIQQLVIGWLGDGYTVIKRNFSNFSWGSWTIEAE